MRCVHTEPSIQAILLHGMGVKTAYHDPSALSILFWLIVQHAAHTAPHAANDTQAWSQLLEHDDQSLATVFQSTDWHTFAATCARSLLVFEDDGEVVDDAIEADALVQYDGVDGGQVEEGGGWCDRTRISWSAAHPTH